MAADGLVAEELLALLGGDPAPMNPGVNLCLGAVPAVASR